MCGILGFSGRGNIKKIVRDGLKSLEYRGYDSCGYALIVDNSLEIRKRVGKGKIDELVEGIPEFVSKRCFVIAHTRWATHGSVNSINTHPHTDCNNEIAVVHNGIIENYHILKKSLEEKGHRFVSETDTEVIAHLIEENEKALCFKDAVAKSLKELEGSFALLIIKKNNDEIIGARKGSPLLIGIREKDFFISSDLHSIVPYTDKILFLEDGEMFVVEDSIEIIDFIKGARIEKSISRIDMDLQNVSEGDFESYMQKEIFEQPVILEKTFSSLYLDFIEGKTQIDFLPGRIIIIGCGSSWHSGLIGEYMMEDFLRIPVEVEYASEFRYRNPVFLPGDLVVAISQSGETADTIGAVREAKGKARILSICNVYNSSISRESDYVLYTQAGPEIGVASTKAFTSQIVALYFLNLLIGYKAGRIRKSVFEQSMKDFNGICKKIKEIFLQQQAIERIAGYLKEKTNALFLGRGIQFPVALEGALKMKEVSYIHAEGYPAAEMKHGPIALIDEHMPAVFVLVKDRFSMKVLSNMQEIKSRGGYVITITDYIEESIRNLSDEIICVPEIDNEYLKPVLTVIPLQMLACFTAYKRGCDVDKPRNLAKSVTVE